MPKNDLVNFIMNIILRKKNAKDFDMKWNIFQMKPLALTRLAANTTT